MKENSTDCHCAFINSFRQIYYSFISVSSDCVNKMERAIPKYYSFNKKDRKIKVRDEKRSGLTFSPFQCLYFSVVFPFYLFIFLIFYLHVFFFCFCFLLSTTITLLYLNILFLEKYLPINYFFYVYHFWRCKLVLYS